MITPSDAVGVLPSRPTRDPRTSLVTANPDSDDIEPSTFMIAVNSRRPWRTPMVTDILIENLPTELRLMALGLSSGEAAEYRPEDFPL
jgi:hypothetical protein